MYFKIHLTLPPIYIYTPRSKRPQNEKREKRDFLGRFWLKTVKSH